ncbi:putative MscS family protein.1 precursor [Jannaschia seosinensis]|uniref:Putative MscS family protein.1 n=1 Tax=Jannaschia seosinensis TaxID=313367 RepID=A0A0M7B8F8_9RHOB|nr:DUF3772 domain-containing protein [Jannaschia seosinensis]CUH39067.1 putative MscS family protein.1 precursor [Jannaschia seosinensis]
MTPRLMRALAGLLLTLLLVLPVAAQEPRSALGWGEIVESAETAIAAEDATIEALDALREQLVTWRATFEAEMAKTGPRVAALRAQIDALEPPPAEGESEPQAIADQREALNAQLEELLAPVREAETVFAEANALIAELDERVEAERAARLFSKSVTPLDPRAWPPAVAAFGSWLRDLGMQVAAPFATPEARAVWQARGLELGLLALIAIVLLWRSNVWLGHLRARVARREVENAVARVALLAISLAQMLLPVAGLVAISRAAILIGISGPEATVAIGLLPVLGFTVLVARWLALQALPKREGANAFLPISPARRGRARRLVLLLGGLIALGIAWRGMAETSVAMAETIFVPRFVLLTLAGIVMFQLGRLFLSEGRITIEEAEEVHTFWAQITRLVGRALIVVGVLAPLAAALGYGNLGAALLWPTAVSLALIALIGILQGFVFDFYVAVTRRTDTGHDALVPTLVGFALALASVPLFGLIWGLRPITLLEWWQTFLRGFDLGGTRISPANFLTFAIVFLIGFFFVRLIRGVLRASVLPKTKLDTGGTNAILSGTSYVGITLAALIAITAAGIDLTGLAVVAGALSLGIGFGLQTIVQNFVSGIILLIGRPIKLGDWINVNGTEGFVREISVRSTRVETFDRQDVIVPNADLISGVVTNYTLDNSAGRVLVTVGVAYGTDTRRVETILQEVAEAHPMAILSPPPLVTFDGFGASSLDFTVRVVIRDILFKVIVHSELNHAVAERFAAEGIEIPFAQRDLWLRNPEVLQPRGEGA